ncbi:MAG: hypothetical protein FWD42_05820 [Solirubrobacterales bacterium]|nr:hypothetical protein [Solirubrobacterales bacterium]
MTLLAALATVVVLAGCGGGSTSTNGASHRLTPTAGSDSNTRTLRASSTETLEPSRAAQAQLTDEEMREYDVNEGRCHDDGGAVRDVGTLDAYCAFPNRSNDFHLLESAKKEELSNEGE